MKTTLALLTMITVALTIPARVEDSSPKAAGIEERLLQTDTKIALKQYTRLKKQEFEARFQFELASDDMPAEKREKLEQKVRKLELWVKETREEILKTGDRLATSRDEADTAKAESKGVQKLSRTVDHLFVSRRGD